MYIKLNNLFLNLAYITLKYNTLIKIYFFLKYIYFYGAYNTLRNDINCFALFFLVKFVHAANGEI